MPALVFASAGFIAGVATGLFLFWSPWIVTPGAALLALAAFRCRPRAFVLLAAAAAGVLWGAGSRARHPGCAAQLPARCEAAAAPASRRAMQAAARERLVRLFGEERAALAAALTVDPEARIAKGERDAYRASGLTHILSISGFHVAILAGALMLLLRACRLRPTTARIAGTIVVAAYIWLLGAPPPAVRAAALLGLWSWSRIRQRPAAASAGVAGTAIVVVALDPFAIISPGPWLSFAGAWGLLAAGAWWKDACRGSPALARHPLGGPLLKPLVVSVAAMLATAPITILVFGSTTPASIVANIAAVPLAAAVVPTIALALLVALPGGGVAFAIASVPAAAANLLLDLMGRVARWSGELPFGTLAFEQRVLAALAAAAVAWLVLRREPATFRPRPARVLLLSRALPAAAVAVAAVVWAPVVAAASIRAAAAAPQALTLFFLPVGQGDAAVLRTPRGAWIVIDGGPRTAGRDAGARVVVPFLRRQGVRRLAALVVSHPHADHLGGVPAILRAFPADVVLESGQPDGLRLYREYLAEVVKRGSRWRAARAGDRLTIDGVTLRVWHPDSAWLAASSDYNENSVVLTVEFGSFRAVFPGDAGRPVEGRRAAQIGDVTLLKVGHHGSRTATGDAWLAALKPEHCVVPVGRNDFGHPNAGVLAALERDGCAIWRTDVHGVVTVTTDGAAATVRGSGGPAR